MQKLFMATKVKDPKVSLSSDYMPHFAITYPGFQSEKQYTSSACMFYFSSVGIVMIHLRTVSFLFPFIHVHMNV